jgi:succinate dehydrogenase / fumarate reductase flavoprotein subunit
MAKLEQLGKVIETDILIVGGGLSGLWSGIRAREFVDNVLIVDKGPPIGYAGEGYFAGGGMQALPPGENVDDFVKDTISLGDGLYEQDLLEKILLQSWDRIEDFQRMGVEFEEEKDGRIRIIPQRGLKHNACYLPKPSGAGGINMMRGLAREANKLGVNYMSRVFISDLIKRNNTVVGAIGFNVRSGRFYIIKAKSVILAAGGCSFRGGYEDTHMCWGEGIEMAFNAGAELRNLEFGTIWIIPSKFRWEGVTYLLPLGAVFVNKQGEQFMDRYSPAFRSNCDYNFLARAMAMEAKEGRCPFYLDCSAMTEEAKQLMTPAEGWTDIQYQQLLEAGIRPFEEPQEWTATPWTNSFVHSDLEMRTKVPGLFVAGVLRNVDPGIYFGGWSICKTAAFGRWAAESASSYAKSISNEPFQAEDEDKIEAMKQHTYANLGKTGIEPEEILIELQKSFFPALILKSEAKLKNALHQVEVIRDELLPQMGSKDLHRLVKANGVRSMTLVAELMLRASLMRTESRASHYREDYPNRDDQNWLKWIMVNQNDGQLNFRFEPMPLDRYKHKTWKYYSDNFKFQK